MTGFVHAIGDFVFLIDSDLEEEPELLGPFRNKYCPAKSSSVFVLNRLKIGQFAFYAKNKLD